MNIALFLGAGASAPYGMPTTKELRDKLKHGGLGFPRKDLLDSDDFPDIEHILSALDELINFVDSRVGRLYVEFTRSAPDNEKYDSPTYPFCIKRLESYVDDSRRSKEMIEELITKQYEWNPANNKAAEKILRPLFDLAKSVDGQVTIFTTNYDTVIEEYCGDADRHMERIDGFKLHSAKRVLVWDGNFAPQNKAYYTKVLLHKLHGSMSWLAGGPGDPGYVFQKPGIDPSSDRTRDMYIRPSLDTKGEATKKEPYAAILQRFVLTLPPFDACIVVGYSFRDPHISEELVKFARSGKVLVVVSPTAAADFEANALKGEPAPGAGAGWDAGDRLRSMVLASGGRGGIVYALNEKIDKDNMGYTIDAIKSAIMDGARRLETVAGGPEDG